MGSHMQRSGSRGGLAVFSGLAYWSSISLSSIGVSVLQTSWEMQPCDGVTRVQLNLQDTILTCAGLKEHEKALTMFLFATTAPTMVVNAITMAAFRKHVLVSLIHTGAALTALLQLPCLARHPYCSCIQKLSFMGAKEHASIS